MTIAHETLVRMILDRAFEDELIRFVGEAESAGDFSNGDLAGCANIVSEAIREPPLDQRNTTAGWCWQQSQHGERFDLTETSSVFLRHLQSRILAATAAGNDTITIYRSFDCRILGELIVPSFEEFREIRRYLESQGFRFLTPPEKELQTMTWSPE